MCRDDQFRFMLVRNDVVENLSERISGVVGKIWKQLVVHADAKS